MKQCSQKRSNTSERKPDREHQTSFTPFNREPSIVKQYFKLTLFVFSEVTVPLALIP
jgi:hypothetical protein